MVEEDEFDKLEGLHETSYWSLSVPDAMIPKERFFQKHQPLIDFFHLATLSGSFSRLFIISCLSSFLPGKKEIAMVIEAIIFLSE